MAIDKAGGPPAPPRPQRTEGRRPLNASQARPVAVAPAWVPVAEAPLSHEEQAPPNDGFDKGPPLKAASPRPDSPPPPPLKRARAFNENSFPGTLSLPEPSTRKGGIPAPARRRETPSWDAPQGAKEQAPLRSDPQKSVSAMSAVWKATQSVVRGSPQAMTHMIDAALAMPDFTTRVIQILGRSLPEGSVSTLLADDQVAREFVTNADLHASFGQLMFNPADSGALFDVLSNKSLRDAVLGSLGRDSQLKGTLDAMGVTPEEFVAAGTSLPHLFDSGRLLVEGKIDEGVAALREAIAEAPELFKKLGGHLVTKLPQAMRDDLTAMGISSAELHQVGEALPDLLKAAQGMGQGDVQGAISHLRDCAGKMPPALVERAITTVAARLPDNAFSGIARSMLTDKALVHQLVTNPELHASFNKLMSGELVQGSRELLGNAKVRDAAARALASNPGFMEKLKPLGIQGSADLVALGGTTFDVLEAGVRFSEGQPGEALFGLGQALNGVPPELKGRMVGALGDKLHLPAWARDTFGAAAGMLDNREVAMALGEAFSALHRGDGGGFLSGIATTGKTLSRTSPETTQVFLGSLSRIPGSIGRLFEDRAFNTALVDSGTVHHVFDAADKLGQGDVRGALGQLAQTSTALLGQGPHYAVGGYALPFGRQGLDNLSGAFGRFVSALPESAKASIATEVAWLGARAGFNSVPGLGSLVPGMSALGSAKALYNALGSGQRDALDISLAAGQLGLDAASLLPGSEHLTVPLQGVLATARVVKQKADLVGDVGQFQRGLVGI
ncbi:MAG: hypothetical protein ABW123_04045 [Cystobacter sp.]